MKRILIITALLIWMPATHAGISVEVATGVHRTEDATLLLLDLTRQQIPFFVRSRTGSSMRGDGVVTTKPVWLAWLAAYSGIVKIFTCAFRLALASFPKPAKCYRLHFSSMNKPWSTGSSATMVSRSLIATGPMPI